MGKSLQSKVLIRVQEWNPPGETLTKPPPRKSCISTLIATHTKGYRGLRRASGNGRWNRLARKVRSNRPLLGLQGLLLNRRKPETERRKWSRLPLAIPVFIRNSDENGKEFLEFATALNVSAGGVLVAVRRSLPLSSPVSLEIPSAPLVSDASLPKAARNFRARAIWGAHADGYQLVGLKFSHSLLGSSDGDRPARRKLVSAV